MSDVTTLRLLADAVLAAHAGFVAFVVLGLAAIIAGNLRGWRWVNRAWLRITHLAAIAFVAVSTWLGIDCPLTTLEIWLRTQARGGTYHSSFVEHWLQRLLYFEAPAWVFALSYSVFGLLVAACWWRWPPERRKSGGGKP